MLRATKTMMGRSHVMSPIGTPHTPFYPILYSHLPHSILPLILYSLHLLYSYLHTSSILISHLLYSASISSYTYSTFYIPLLYIHLYSTIHSPFSSSHQSPNTQLSSSTSSSQSLYSISRPSNSRRIIYHSSTFSFLWLAANSLPMRTFHFIFSNVPHANFHFIFPFDPLPHRANPLSPNFSLLPSPGGKSVPTIFIIRAIEKPKASK